LSEALGALVPDVAPKTDMYVLRHRKPVIEVQEKITEGRLIEFCRELEPPALTQRHVTALNQISGTRFGSIKKLAALRQKQSWNGRIRPDRLVLMQR